MFTSTGRHLYTGPQELLECSLHISRFDQAGNEQRPPVALFIDPSTSFAGTIRSMGAVFNDEEEMEQPRRRKEIEFILPVKAGDGPIFPAEPNIHTYLTTAYFSKVTCLKKQMRRGRCVGLYIERERDPKRIDPPQILGQWDPACTQGITTIYPAGPGEPEPVEALTFVFAPESQPGAGGRHCVDVLVGRHESIRQPKYISETFPHVSSCSSIWVCVCACDGAETDLFGTATGLVVQPKERPHPAVQVVDQGTEDGPSERGGD